MGRYSYSSRKTVSECKTIDVFWLNKHDYFSGYKSGGIEWKRGGKVTSSIGIEVNVLSAGDRRFRSTADNPAVSNFPDNSYMRLYYTQTNRFTGEKTELDYKVKLVTTPCNLGGVRYWFICSLVVDGKSCLRRVGKLYLPPGGKYFGCRHCYDLTYESCKKSGSFHYENAEKHAKRMRKIREQLGGSSSLIERFPQKPKGVSFLKYDKLFSEYIELAEKMYAGMEADLKRFMDKLES